VRQHVSIEQDQQGSQSTHSVPCKMLSTLQHKTRSTGHVKQSVLYSQGRD